MVLLCCVTRVGSLSTSARYEHRRQLANTKISSNKTVRRVRVRSGNVNWRALRLDAGNISWGSEAVTRKTHILDVVYNASNNELVRTQILIKDTIVQDLGCKKAAVAGATNKSAHNLYKEKK
nr:40S ribosomal protein S8-like [Tanacetum cinerariifolium]